ncbi:OmpH family outer membrane protein [Nguyenibacter vanlangensis]|uniref:OmpH family outer membrane protein n=2 Tax=Nguyenibacter vanlangensis TaxID=1216886 RepID=A0ABZ3DAA5_9PROT
MTDLIRAAARGVVPTFRPTLFGLCAVLCAGAAHAAPARPAAAAAPAASDGEAPAGAAPVLPAPAVPVFGPLPAGPRPPAPVIGLFDPAEIMRQSVAVQQVEQEMAGRRDALIHDVRAEETEVQTLRQRMMSAPRDKAEAQQRALQQRVAADQRKFGNRNRILQEDIQIAMNQVQREVGQVVASVSKSRGLTLVMQSGGAVLHGPQVDITDQVIAQLNTILPHVYLPAANEDPEVVAKSGKFPTAPVQMSDPGQQG